MKFKTPFRMAALAALIAVSGSAQGQTTYTWSGTTEVMNVATNWSPASVPLGSAQDRLLFDGSSAISSLVVPGGTFGGNPGLGGLTFAATQTAPLTIVNSGGAGSVFRLTSNANVLIEAGAGAVIFGGSGNAYLLNLGNGAGSANTFTNNSGSIASILSGVSLNATGGGSGSRAVFTGSGDWLMSGNFTSTVSRGVGKEGTGRLTLTNTGNAFVGGLAINGGSVVLGASEVITNNQTVTLGAAGTLDLNGFSETVGGLAGIGVIENNGEGTSTISVGFGNAASSFGGILRDRSGAGNGVLALTKTGTGVLTLSGTNQYSGITTVGAGTLAIVSGIEGSALVASAASLSGEGSVGGSVTFDGGSIILVDAVTTAALHVTGDVVLNGLTSIGFSKTPVSTAPFNVLTYDGALVGDVSNLSLLGGTLSYRTPVIDTSVPGLVTAAVGTEARTWNGGGIWDINGTPNWLEADNSYFQLDSVTFKDTGAGSIALSGVLAPLSITVDSSADYVFTGDANNYITGATGITKAGSGTLTLGGVNAFTGDVVVQGGTLKAVGNQSLGANGRTIIVTNGATLDVNGALNANRDHHAFISGDGVGGVGAIINSGATTNSGFGKITLKADASIGGTGRFDLRPITAGTGSLDLAGFTLTKVGSNLIALVDSVITASGSIDINEGTLAFTRNTVSGEGSVNVNNGSTMLFENYTAGSFSKAVSIDGSNLRIINNPLSISSPISVTNIATFQTLVNLTLTGPLGGNGALSKTDGGALILAADATHSGGTSISGGALQIGNGGTTGSLAGDVVNDGQLTFNRSGTYTYGGAVSGTGAVVKQGTGSLVLTGALSHTGATTVAAGELIVNGSIGESSVTVAAAGTLGGSGSFDGGVRVNGTVSPGPGVGRLTSSFLLEMGGGSNYQWEIGNWNGTTPGTDWDQLVSNDLYISATPENRMRVTISGSPAGFAEEARSFQIARSEEVAFLEGTEELITVDASGFIGNGTWELVLADSDKSLVLNYTPGVADPYQQWLGGFPAITDPVLRGPTADADGDGLANMLEYVLNADPSDSASRNLPTAAEEDGKLVFRYSGLKAAGGAGYTSVVEISSDLAPGSWLAADEAIVEIVDQGSMEDVTVRIPMPSGASRIFARLAVSVP